MPHKQKSGYNRLEDDVQHINGVSSSDTANMIFDHVYYNHNYLVMDGDDHNNNNGKDFSDDEKLDLRQQKLNEHKKDEYKELVQFIWERNCEECMRLQTQRRKKNSESFNDRKSYRFFGDPDITQLTEHDSEQSERDLELTTEDTVEILCETCKQNRGIKTVPDEIYEETAPKQGENIYDAVAAESSDGSWSDSEFESYTDDDMNPNGPSTKSRRRRAARTSFNIDNGVLMKIKNSIRHKATPPERVSDPVVVSVDMNEESYPPPSLPAAPDGLTLNQTKRRHVVDNIIQSEQSYVRSLQYILQEYRDTLLDMNYLFRGKVRVILRKIAELVQYHKMFQIELADAAHRWDDCEEIGDVFTASFSKSMVVDAYSEYVNNYAPAMEDVRKLTRQKQPFADMLKQKEATNPDRLSVFGLMVKPVQRFPQFIMFLQDLLKYTTTDHHDRMKLQRALTELEGIAHKLNDRKRESEQRLAARQIVSSLLKDTITWKSAFVVDANRYLVRQDGFYQVVGHTTPQVYKWRRLIMLSDLLICVNVHQRERDTEVAERYKVKWCVGIKDVELKETSITPEMFGSVKSATRWHNISSLRLEPTDEDPLGIMTELTDLVHDHTILSQISNLASSLRRNYPTITEGCIEDTMNAVQVSIHQKDEQARLVGSCSFVLEVPISCISLQVVQDVNGHIETELDKAIRSNCLAQVDSINRGTKRRYVFQAMTAQHKEDWLTDLHMAKLSLCPSNCPGWSVVRGTEDVATKLPALFLRCLSVDVPRYYTKMQCAVAVTLPTSTYSASVINHLWVCSSTENMGQVSLVALQCSRPRVLESFLATTTSIIAIEAIPGCPCLENPYAFPEATVWMATAQNEMVIYDVQIESGLKRYARATFKTPGEVIVMKYIGMELFVALATGKLAIYSRDKDGVWNISNPTLITIGQQPVTCLLLVDEYLTCMCDGSISMLDPTTHEIERVLSLDCEDGAIIQDIARAGMGLWISYRNSSLIHLYHLETMDRLQDINVSSVVQKSTSDRSDYYSGLVSVTCMVTSKGLLWIGTNTGHILTIPLPRLREGVPQITSRPDISFHSHQGPVRFIIPLYSAVIPKDFIPPIQLVQCDDKNRLFSTQFSMESEPKYDDCNVDSTIDTSAKSYEPHKVTVSPYKSPTVDATLAELKNKFSENSLSNSSVSTENDVFLTKEDLNLAFQIELRERVIEHSKKWKSTPNLNQANTTEDISELYGSLMKGPDNTLQPDQITPPKISAKPREVKTLAAVGRRVYTRAMRWRKGQSEMTGMTGMSISDDRDPVYVNIEDLKRASPEPLFSPDPIPITHTESMQTSTITSVSSLTPSLTPNLDDSTTSAISKSSYFCDISTDSANSFINDHPPTLSSTPSSNSRRSDIATKGGLSKAVMVVSGGDGYFNFMRSSDNLTRQEASLMVWIYKADF